MYPRNILAFQIKLSVSTHTHSYQYTHITQEQKILGTGQLFYQKQIYTANEKQTANAFKYFLN